MLGTNFPISDYYREHIIDAETIARSGGWWTAVLLIKDPKKSTPFLGIYRWQYTESGWKVRNRFYIRSNEQLQKIVETIEKFSDRLPKKATHKEEVED